MTKNKPNELYITRLYDAPLEKVWAAWVDPEQVGQWWGPRGFTLTNHGKDVRTGGFWKYTMHGPDGVDYPNYTIYHEVVKHEKMVYDHGGNEDQPPMFRVTALFSEENGKTKLDMTMAFASAEIATQTKKFIKQASGDSTWDRLAEYLAQEINHKDIFVINRTFDAPIDLMYEMWTDPKHVAAWMAPTGAEMKYHKADIKVGGTSFWEMGGPHGKMFGRAKYVELKAPNRVVYIQQFVDENENVSRHPMAPTWPESMLTTIVLTEEENEKTRVTITWEPYGKTKTEEVDTFKKARGGMTMGWTGSFDKLEDFLTKEKK